MTDRPDASEGTPLTAAQSGLWYAQQREPGTPAYNCAEYVDLVGPLDPDAFAEAVRQAVEEAGGRTCFPESPDGEPRALASAGPRCEPARIDRSGDADPVGAAHRWMREDLGVPYDLAAGPVVRQALITVGPEHHLWYLGCPHIVLDAHGFGLVQRRAAELYRARVLGGRAPEPRFGSAADLHRREEEYRTSQQCTADREHWRRLLADRPRPSTPAAGSAPPAPQHHRFHAPLAPFASPAASTAGDRSRDGAEDGDAVALADGPEVRLAAVAGYLHRTTGRSDVVLGLPFAGRLGPAARVPAPTVNVLPLAVDLAPADTPRQIVARVADALSRLRVHARYRGEEIRRDLRLPPERPLTGPLVNVGLTTARLRLDGVTARVGHLAAGAVDDLTVTFRDPAEGPDQDAGSSTLTVDGNPALYDEDQVAAHGRRIADFLRRFATRPDEPLGLLDTAADEEAAGMPEYAERAAEARAGHRPGPTLPELFHRQVAARPDAVALTDGDREVTYRQLDADANRLAHRLRSRGAGREDLVALALPRSADLVTAVLAVLKAGAGYLPLDPGQPAARTAAVLAAARPALVVTAPDADIDLPGELPLLELKEDAAGQDRPAQPDDEPPPAGAGEHDCAYVIHTSGSTGRPKGVVVTHRNVARLLSTTAEWFAFGPDDVWTLFHSHAFDFSVWELFGALLTGGRLVVVPYRTSRDPEEFLRLLAHQRVTVLNQTPAAFGQLIEADRADPRTGDRLALRHVVLGGEALQPAVLAGWYRRHPHDAPRVTNMYGITETTVHVTHRALREADTAPEATGLVGTPIPDLRVRLLDTALCPVPPGTVGEVYVAGPGLARGYLGRPDLTADRFLPDPYGPPGSRMYRTGDLAVRDEEGALDHRGRADDQVKIRGFRVEPAEIEVALLDRPDVARCAVLATEDSGDGRALVAYAVPAHGTEPEPDELRRHLSRRLPEHMVPSDVVLLETLPITGNGKVDRAALPRPARRTSAPPRRAPASPAEAALCEVFADLLDREQVDADADFFALGGHSLLATRLVGRVRRLLDAEIAVRDLFEAPTPARLAARLAAAREERPGPVARPMPQTVPLSYAQRRLWFLHRLEGPSPTYNIPLSLRLTGELDTAALEQAIADVVARHEPLRTVFPAAADESRQHILPPEEAAVPLPVTEVPEERVEAELAHAARYAFDLGGHPPLRARLWRTGPQAHVLLLLLHHAAGDDWSLGPLAADLATAYAARRTGHAPRFPRLPVHYRDYAQWQRETLAAGQPVAERQRDFWRRALEGLPDQLDLPCDHRRPAVATHRGGTVPLTLDAELHGRVREVARENGVTVFMVIQAALAALLTRLGAGTDIPVGSPVAGRSDSALEDLVGFFANTVVLRTDTSGDPDFRTLLRRVRETDLAAFDHLDLPFERLVEELAPARSAARHPLFQVMLAYGTAPPVPQLDGLRTRRLRPHNGSAKFDLTVCLDDAPGGGAEGFVEYAADLFDEDGARALAERLVRLLRQSVADPGAPVGRHELLSAEERHRMLGEWNATDAPVDPRSFPEMFEDAARAHPEREALIAGPLRWTYRELNRRANRLAHRLIRLGAGPERTVGIQLPRGAELVAALLAVQKAGAAFVPLDPAWPAERRDRIAEGARPVAVLTTPPAREEAPRGTTALALDAEGDWFADEPESDPGVAILPDSLAYVIYTSGSTGTPKGAMIRHRSLSNRLPWQTALLGLTPDDPVLHKAPLSFDISVNEVFLPLACGAPLVLAEDGRGGDVAHLLEVIRRERVSFVYLVSSILDIMLDREDVAEAAVSLRHVWCGGEVLTPELFSRFRGRLPQAVMYHGYGPAETTIGVTCQVYRGDAGEGITIGRPNPNTRVYVLDPGMRPVPPGVPGELYLGGVPLGRGYLGDPRRTAQSFVPDPFSGLPGERLYRTGDLARYRDDGDIEFLGRVDNQVKINGVRVEPEETEAHLAGHPSVRQAAVVVTKAVDGRARLSAWCTPDPSATAPDGGGLLDWLRTRLPSHLVPHDCRVVPSLPLMPSGKVDRKALAARPAEPASKAGPGQPAAPAEGTEQMVAEVWEGVLGVPAGAHDNFFDLGGHSLLLARVQTGLRARLGWDVPLLDLLTRPTVSAVAAHLDSRDGQAPPSASEAGAGEALGVLLPLREEGDLPPLFCVHPASGLSWPFTGLRPHVDRRRPLYGIQSPALAGRDPVPGSLTAMAAAYLEQIRRVQPRGPYHLAGWSFGGVVAHTMATMLQESGEQVALLALLDSYPRYPWEKLSDDHEQQALRSLLYMSHYDLDRLDDRPLTRESTLAAIAEQGGILAELTPDTVQGVMDTFVASAVLQQDHRHGVHEGDVLFFTATERQVDPTLSHRDWKPYVAGEIENHDVRCEHKDMTRRGPLAEIGRHLDRRLRDLAG